MLPRENFSAIAVRLQRRTSGRRKWWWGRHNRRRLEVKPPFLSQGIDASCDTFRRIPMKYVDDEEGIQKYFAAFHLHDKPPVAVVIDDFGYFFSERRRLLLQK